MIVAGSVLALLLMGLAVDGFVNPADEEPDDTSSDVEPETDQADQSGGGDGLNEMLFAEDDTSPPQTPPGDLLEQVDLEAEEEPTQDSTDDEGDWARVATATPDSTLLDVDTVIEVDGIPDVAYVETFDTDTDILVLEFSAIVEDTPEIIVEYDPQEDAAIVLANGFPVALVEGAGDMGADHVRIVMDDDEDAVEPRVQLETTVPEGPETLDTALINEDADSSEVHDLLSSDDQGDAADAIIDAPVHDFVDTTTDGVPDAEEIDANLDHVIGDLDGAGGVNEMLDARSGIDDVFGVGGDDAQTGTHNNDLVLGTSGQDALFGDDGDDTLDAGAGNDELHGGFGHDNLNGESGVDFLDGGEGNDHLDGGGDRDLLFGGDGDDVLYGGAANDFLQGGLGADHLDGGSGDDVLDGVFGDGATDQDSADTLWGGADDDTLILGQGDTAHGGSGADTFVSGAYVEHAEIAGHVEDFDPAEDRIEVIFDPVENPSPTLEVHDFEDGSGADIVLNGEVILSVAGAQGLDPNMITLQAVA